MVSRQAMHIQVAMSLELSSRIAVYDFEIIFDVTEPLQSSPERCDEWDVPIR
jgi:hypothetical protein